MPEGKQKIIQAWKNLPKNITQQKRFKADIDKKAREEAKAIIKKLNRGGTFVGTTKMPIGDVPGSWTKEKETERQVYEQIKKVRRQQAKQKGII